jgi:diacylglycerol kinase (ATP)
MSKTLVVLNPHAAGGKTDQLWKELEPALTDQLGELVVEKTAHPDEVVRHLTDAYTAGLTRVISVGGDGTNHVLVNALADLRTQNPDGPPMIYGTLPVGTGRDWARSLGIPFQVTKAANWIARAAPHPIDIGLLTYTVGGQQKQEHFLNIASAGMSGDVDRRVNQSPTRRPWTFFQATVAAILTYKPQVMRVTLDGELWYEGKTFVVVVANGTTFGHGMKIAPEARIDDGLFDVFVIEGISRPSALWALQRVYNGTHLTHPAVHFKRAKQVQISSDNGPLGLDLDGEHAVGQDLTFSLRPGLLHLLTQSG